MELIKPQKEKSPTAKVENLCKKVLTKIMASDDFLLTMETATDSPTDVKQEKLNLIPYKKVDDE